jgi:cytochrome c biogenesis protein CcdA
VGSLALAFLAGVLSILSPCVLPLVPIVLGAAAAQGRFGPFALAFGLATSFVAVGLFVALAGFSIGLDQDVFRTVTAVLLIAVGAVLAVPALQTRVALAAGPASGWLGERLNESSGIGVTGQFGVGFLLGAVWSPCVGPTLGAASLLAAQGKDLGAVTLTMIAFGLGAALPLLLLGLVSREAMQHWRSRLLNGGTAMKAVLGVLLALTGLLVLTGFDKRIETVLVELSPAWLTELTIRY